MRSFVPILFGISILGLCWLGMMAVHELGHVLAAAATGGTIERVVLHPLEISRTDVSPNPSPTVVVWGGPLAGVLLPVGWWLVMPARFVWPRGLAQFFAGFCLIANGAYIGLGSLARIGDCGEMLRHGSPIGLLWLFGAVTMPAGFWLWHRLGDAGKLFAADVVSLRGAMMAAVCLVGVVSVEMVLGYFR